MALRSYFGWRLVRLYIVGLVFAGFAVSNLLPDGFSPSRWFDGETRLGVTEGKITGIDDEFLRRSPAMQALLKEYQECRPNCSSSFNARREAIIQSEWPKIFERIRVDKDWISIPQANKTKEQIKEMVRRYGRDGVVARCKPKIYFSNAAKTSPVFEKFECKPPGTRAGG